MADISVIKLPNGSSYNLKDSQAIGSATFSGHELTLVKRGSGTQVVDLGDFDTINVTDANIGNLVVTGSARFTNGIFGDLIGNAQTATTATTANKLATETGLSAGARPVWYSYLGDNSRAVYDTNFTYNPSGGILKAVKFDGTATKATGDESGNNIKANYAASISISGHTITLSNKNGTSLGSVTVPDNNVNTWRAIQVNGTQILAADVNTALNLKAGSNVSITNSSGTVTIASTNTTYEVVSKTANGLAPQLPNETTTTKYLRQDGTWAVPPDNNTHNTAYLYAGASNGTANAATTNGNTYLILMDGGSATTRRKIAGSGATTVTSDASGNITISSTNTWTKFVGATASAAGTDGYITAPTAGNHNKFLRGDGTWAVPTDNNTWTAFVGATASAAGTAGYVPAPGAGNQAKFFRGDGTWATPTNTTYSAGVGLTLSSNKFNLDMSGTEAGSGMRYINTNDMTTWTAQALSETDSIAFTRGNVTDAYTTGHMVWLNARTIGTPFQLVVHDSSDLYLYKRWYTNSAWSSWTKMKAGHADSAGSATTATYSNYPNITNSNEIRFNNKPSSVIDLHFGYKWADGTSDAKISSYRFENGNGALTNVYANTFYGALSGNATTATTASRVSSAGAGTANANRHVWFSDSSTETARNHDDDFMYNPSTNVLTVGSITGTATYATTTADTTNALYPVGVTSGATTTLKRDTSITMTGGAVTGTSFAASSYLAANSSNSGTTGGLALYGTSSPTNYGITMRQTTNRGKHGFVQSDWAIYNHMSGGTDRGFIWQRGTTSVASISGSGSAAFNGEVAIGTTGTNIIGSCSLSMDRDLGCLNFIFN